VSYPEAFYSRDKGEISAMYRPADTAPDLAMSMGTAIDTTTGDFLYVPQGGVHAFRNTSGKPASLLLFFTAGAPREAYFEELAEIAASGRRLSDEEWTAFYLRHDQRMV
jgi:hypothetical protein